MDINSHVSQKEMKNLVWFALLAIKTISCDLSLATLKENYEMRCCFFLPSSFSDQGMYLLFFSSLLPSKQSGRAAVRALEL